MGLNRSGLYYRPVPPSAEEIVLKHRIDEIFTAYPFDGSRKITAQLKREGWGIGRKAVQRHMREMGLEAVSPGPNLSRRKQRPRKPIRDPRLYRATKEKGVTISIDGKGRPIDNIFTERLWRSLKHEEVYLLEYQNSREARTGIGGYLKRYNHHGLHQSLDYRTPAEVYSTPAS